MDLTSNVENAKNEVTLALQTHNEFIHRNGVEVDSLKQQVQGKKEYLKMTNFSQYDDRKSWFSKNYFSLQGYNMYMSIWFSNEDESEEYISCYIYFTKGKYDDTLEWPF